MKGSTMESTRRTVLRQGSVLALLASCGVLTLREALAADANGFSAKTLADALHNAVVNGDTAERTRIMGLIGDVEEAHA